jgi:hypothetical protein
MKDTKPIFVAGLEDIIQEEAARAAHMARTAKTSREAGGKAIAAIVLAMAAVEAMIDTWTALFKNDYGVEKNTLNTWRGKGLHEIIKDILSRLKPPVAVGTLGWYQRLSAFVELRNHCVHYYPEFRQTGTWPERLEPYIRNGSIRPIGDDTMDWTARLLVPSVAQQAVDCAREVMEQFFSTAWRQPN